MISHHHKIDPSNIPEELRPILARFFKSQASKKKSIQRDINYHFEKKTIMFSHDIYPRESPGGRWRADVLADEAFYHNDFTTGRKVIAVIYDHDNHQDEAALHIKPKPRRCYFFLAPELNSSLPVIKRFSARRPRFFRFNNTNIVSMLVEGESYFDCLNNERTFAGKALSSRQRFRMVISLIRACMEFHQFAVCNREITVKDIFYDAKTNQTHLLSFRLAKMMNDVSMSCGGTAHSVYGAPEEFISQSTQRLITYKEDKKRSSIISKAGLPADVYMVGFVSILVWRHVYTNYSANLNFVDYVLQRAHQGWEVVPNLFDKIVDLSQEEQPAILYLSSLLLNPENPESRPVIEDCFYRYQMLYLNHKLLNLHDEVSQARLIAANQIARSLHMELYLISCRSILLNDCNKQITEFALGMQQSFSVFKDKLESNKKNYLIEIILLKLEGIERELKLAADATIADFIQQLTALAGAAKLQKTLFKYLDVLEDHPDAIAELLEYCDLRCLFDIENKNELLAGIQQIFDHHVAMLQLFQQHAHHVHAEVREIKYQLANDTMTLDHLAQQSSHIERKFGKLRDDHPQVFRRLV